MEKKTYKYKVEKGFSIYEGGVIYNEGDIVELTEERAKALGKMVKKVKEKDEKKKK